MAYNKIHTTPAMRGLIQTGADLMANMYDVKIWFPSANGTPSDTEFVNYPLTARATAFTIPDVETATYDVKYHGIGIKRPKTDMTFERMFTIEFREDAAFDLRRRLTAWHMAVADPVTGATSNATQFFGRVSVGTIAGAYFASTLVTPNGNGEGKATAEQIFDSNGHLTNSNTYNPMAMWVFHDVWVGKVGGVKFQTETADPNKFETTFYFHDYDAPQYGGNSLDLGEGNTGTLWGKRSS